MECWGGAPLERPGEYIINPLPVPLLNSSEWTAGAKRTLRRRRHPLICLFALHLLRPLLSLRPFSSRLCHSAAFSLRGEKGAGAGGKKGEEGDDQINIPLRK